jgi:UDP:flavonoid glycosyltransferase YjiC (YdhE family)
MTRYLFLTWPGGGNQPPAIGLAQEFRSRGHEIVFAGYAPQQPRFAEQGFRFVVLTGSQAALGSIPPEDGLAAIRDGIVLCAPQLEEVPEVFAGQRADVLVVDCMLLAALMAVERAHLPAAVLVHSPPGALLHPDRPLWRAVLPALNALRASSGLEPVDRPWETWAGASAICTSIAQLDPDREEIPPECEYVGPIFESVPPSGWRSPWSKDDERPLILVSFSTGQTFPQRSRIERSLEGLAGKPYRVLVTGNNADIAGIEAPANAVLVEHVPHGEILPDVAVAVTHAGHGTIAASLAHGVPLVCLPNPLVADQPALASQVERLGAGRALDGEAATAADIAAAVEEAVAAPTYRAAAQGLAQLIADAPGATGAAAQLERHRLPTQASSLLGSQ